VSRRGRLLLFALGGATLAAVLVIAERGLPSFGDYHGVYGRVVQATEPVLRRATDLVTALNFDLRAFDTVGEEFILFASVAGVALILRRMRDEDDRALASTPQEHRFTGASDALQLLTLALVPTFIALGVYVIIHGALTPGGGFQGGIVLAAGPLAMLLAGRYLALKRLAPVWALESVDAAGAMAYVLIGLGGLVFASSALQNFLPLGTPGQLLSAGTMPLSSIAVGIEVTGAFLLTWTEFLDQALIVERRH
jgi:multicomponent Na+:H+ antiporter subunit B